MSNELSLEKKFQVEAFKQQVQMMSREQAQGLLVEMYGANIVREQMYQKLLKQRWGLKEINQQDWGLDHGNG